MKPKRDGTNREKNALIREIIAWGLRTPGGMRRLRNLLDEVDGVTEPGSAARAEAALDARIAPRSRATPSRRGRRS